MALIEGCRHSIEVTVPLADVQAETERAVVAVTGKVRLPGFRPGKAPASLVRTRFAADIRQDVVEALIPKAFRKAVEADGLKPVSQPRYSDVHFHDGEPLKFKAEFEVEPEFELGAYRDLPVVYNEPAVADSDIDERLEKVREQKAEYVNIDPRPLDDGDYAVVSLQSLAGAEPPIQQDELMLKIGDENTLAGFSEHLKGLSPDDEREFDITYPEDYDRQPLAGKTVKFRATVKAVRQKELPEANDEFAKDLGDYQTLDELKAAIRTNIQREREFEAQQEAKTKLIDQMVESHPFAVPEVYVDRQIEMNVERRLRALAAEGIDPKSIKLDWEKVRESQKDQALKDVRASLLLDKIATAESLDATQDEVDKEVQRFAKQQREAVAVTRAKLQKDGTIGRIANSIRTEKTLAFLFERARKSAE